MAELISTKLNAETHSLLARVSPRFSLKNNPLTYNKDQPLLRLPYELNRKTFKTAQLLFEHERKQVLSSLKSTANASFAGQSAPQSISSLDQMINRMQGLKRKLASLHEEEKILHQHSRKRIQHLQDLYEIPSLADVKYDQWARVRLNRLLVDYLLRSGYGESARALANEKGIEEMVDLDVFVQCHQIEESLRRGDTQECLAWCQEHKPIMKKFNVWTLSADVGGGPVLKYAALTSKNPVRAISNSNCGYSNSSSFDGTDSSWRQSSTPKSTWPRTQEPTSRRKVELQLCSHTLQTRRRNHTRYLTNPNPDNGDNQRKPYVLQTMYSQSRWDHLADLFVRSHHEIFSLPARPLLHIALSAGLSALKTPACHSKYASSSANATFSSAPVCPICSTELNELARNLPYAHHTKSHVENDPVVLPNGRVYGRERLLQMSAKIGLEDGLVKDPTTSKIFKVADIRKVYIS